VVTLLSILAIILVIAGVAGNQAVTHSAQNEEWA
jgi:hypothetical protein